MIEKGKMPIFKVNNLDINSLKDGKQVHIATATSHSKLTNNHGALL